MDQIASDRKGLLNGIISTGITTNPSLNRFILLNIPLDNSENLWGGVELGDIDLLLGDNGFGVKYLEFDRIPTTIAGRAEGKFQIP